MVSYLGNGAYCYANSTAMLLTGIGEHVSPSLVEVLTGVGLGAFWIPGANLIYFSSNAPDVGISQALDTLGFEYTEKSWTDAESGPFAELRADMQPTAVLGPLDMGYLDYLPYRDQAAGADHYVLVYALDEDEARLHDPDGFPHVSLPLDRLTLAWKAERIEYRRGSYRYWTAPRRVRNPGEQEIYERAMAGFRAAYQDAQERLVGPGWLNGRDAILACADFVRHGAPPSLADFLTGFSFRLGARRALDYAAFLQPHDDKLAALKDQQAELFGRCHVRAMRRDWSGLAQTLEALADVETAFQEAMQVF